MAYSAPSTRSTGYTVTAANWNELVNNQLYFAARQLVELTYKLSGDVTGTGTSFIDVDATNLNLSFTNQTSQIVCMATFRSAGGGGAAYFDLILDSVTRAGDATYGLNGSPGTGESVTLLGVWKGVSAATHSIKLQYKTSGSTNGVEADHIVQMLAWEV